MKKEILTIYKQFRKRDVKKIIRKLIEVLYGYPLLLLSFFTIRNNNKIVIGSHTPFNDNSKYFYLLNNLNKKGKRVIWISHNKKLENEIKNYSKEVYYRWSLKGLYHSLTARYYIFCFHLIDINFWTSGNTIKINLWHGIPLKNIEFSVKSGSSVNIYNEKNIIARIFAPYIFVRPNYLISTSPLISEYYKNAFRIENEGRIKSFGQPRCDIFFWEETRLLEFIKKFERKTLELYQKTHKYSKRYIYMPTWRDYDFIKYISFDFKKLNEIMIKENSVFLIKTHPATKVHMEREYSNIILLNNSIDIYPYLPFTDCLITDYSSIYYDYMLLKKPILLFPFDEDKYISEDRGFIWKYNESMPGSRFYTFSDLITSLNNSDIHILEDKDYDILYQKYWRDYSGSSVKRIEEIIL